MPQPTHMPVESAPKLRISPRLTKFCEWSASFTGLAGAALVASKSDWAGYGFLAFLASNIAWIAYSVRTKTWSLLVMQLGFTATSLLGIKNWLLQ